jgi:hypothetical protein
MPSADKDSADDPLRLHGIQLRDSAKPVSLEQLAEIESGLGFRLPAEYRSFLLCANGGIPEANRFHYTVVDHEEGTRRQHKARITRFLSAIPAEVPSGQDKSLVTFYKNVAFGLPDRLLPIAVVEDAMEGGMLCIAVKGKQQGRIYYWPEQEIGEDTLHRVADSFDLLLAMLAQQKTKDAGPASGGQKPRKLSLARAAAMGQLEDVQRLLERGASPYTAYAHAAEAGQAAILCYLLTSGALKEVGRDALEFTQPRLWRELELIRGLINAGADVNYTFFDGTTPLHGAAQHGSPEVVKYLLDCGAKPGVWSRSLNQTPLHRAVFDAREADAFAKMKLLLDAGEDLHARRPGPMQSPPGLAEHLSQRVGGLGPGLAELLGPLVNQITQPQISAAELLISQGRAQLLQELEQYVAGRRQPSPDKK